MEGRIRPQENLGQLLSILQKAKADRGLEKPRKVKIYKSKPEQLDDDELMLAADALRKERAALASKLINAGLLDPAWDQNALLAQYKNK